MPATIRIDFDVHAEGISEALKSELSKIQGVVASANSAIEATQTARISAVAKKAVEAETAAIRTTNELRAKAEKDIEGIRSAFSAKVWGDEKKAATAIVGEISRLQEQKDSLMRAAQLDGISKVELAQINAEKKKLDRELGTTRRIALENKQIAEHGAAASVGIMGIGRNIENNFDKAVGKARGLQGALGVAGGFTLAGLVESATKAKDQSEGIATVLRSAGVPAEQIDKSVQSLKEHTNEFADKMGLSRERSREVATEVIGLTNVTGKAAEQASDLALAYEHSTGGMISAEKFAKLLTKSIGDPENEKSLKILEAKYPGIGAQIAAAATEQDKLNILQQAAAPAMDQMAENASGAFDRIGVVIGSAKDSIGDFIGKNMDTIGVMGQVSAGVLPLAGTFSKLGVVQKLSTAAQWLWNAAMNANPIGLLVAGIAALVGGLVLLYNNVKPVRDAIDSMVSWVVTAYHSFMDWYESLGTVGKVAMALILPITALIEPIKSVVHWLGDLFSSEEKVTESTNKNITATISAAEAEKKRASAISETIKKLDDEKKSNEDGVKTAHALLVDALEKEAFLRKRLLDPSVTGDKRKAMQDGIVEIKGYISDLVSGYGKGAVALVKQRAALDAQAASLLHENDTKKEADLIAQQKQLYEAHKQELEDTIVHIQKIVALHQTKSAADIKIQADGTKAVEDLIKVRQKVQIDAIHAEMDAELSVADLLKASGILKEKEYNAKIFIIKSDSIRRERDLYRENQDEFAANNEKLLQLSRAYRAQDILDSVAAVDEKKRQLLDRKIKFINEDAAFELHSLDVKKAAWTTLNELESVAREREYQQAIYEIKLAALKKQLRIYQANSDEYRATLDVIQSLERSHELDSIKLTIDAAKAKAKAFDEEVNKIRDTALAYTDLISKVLSLHKVEKERNKEMDAELDKQLIRLDKTTQAKLKLAKTDKEREQISNAAEKQQGRLIDANEQKQKEAAAAGSQFTAQQKIESLVKAGASMVQAIANIIANSASLGPFGILAAPATIGAAFAMYEAAKTNLGFETGGYTGKGKNDDIAGYVHKNEYVLRAGSFEVDPDGNLVSVHANNKGPKNTITFTASTAHGVATNDDVITAINAQTQVLAKNTILNQNRVVIENKRVQRSMSRESV